MTVDLNRPLSIRVQPDGRRVCMDKSQPGIFFDGAGNPLTEADAASAGYDVKRLAMERRKNEALAGAREEIERKHKDQMAEVTLVMEHIYEGGDAPTIEKAGDRAYRLMVGDEPLSGCIHQRKADAESILDMAGANEDSAVEEPQPPQDSAPEIPSEKPEPEVASNGTET